MSSLLILLSISAPPLTSAEPIYRHVDAQGRVTFSTTPPDTEAAPQSLPTIKRESSAARIQRLRSELLPTCNSHGGIECEKGPDGDGSVICRDGSRDSAEQFAEFCASVRLQIDGITVHNERGEIIEPKSAPDMALIKEARITVRNLTGIEARGVEGMLKFPRPSRSLAIQGPAKVDPYGFAEYTVDLTEARTLYLQKFLQMKPAIRCENCRIVLGSR